MTMDPKDLLQLYYYMRLTRAVEDRTRTLFLQGKIVGGVFTAQGQEAVSVGSAYALQDGDVISPLHRDVGAHLVRGVNLRDIFSQWLAKETGPTHGRDGQVHGGTIAQGIIPMISMLGPTIPVSAGVALAMKMRKQPNVVVAYIGDGATNTGEFHEGMNFAAVQNLPLVLIIENNGYAYSTPTTQQFKLTDLTDRAMAFGIPGYVVDGNDVLAVHNITREATEYARSGNGAAIIEAKTFRMRGHSEADNASYVPKEKLAEWAQKDPIKRFEEYLAGQGILNEQAREGTENTIKQLIDDAVEFAMNSPQPDPATVADNVYSDPVDETWLERHTVAALEKSREAVQPR